MTIYDTRNKRLHAPGVRRVVRRERPDGTEPTGIRVTASSVTADDGHRLEVTWFRPAAPVRGAVVVVGAMATKRRFYEPFARWLAESGFITLTFDYRGMASPAAMRAETCDVVRWTGDAASALEALVQEVGPNVPVSWVGHSLGGQALPFARHDLVDAVVLVSAGSGFWRLMQPAKRRRAPFLWLVVAPVATRIAGYFPGRRLGIAGDLPPNVMRQWARWCLHESYAAVDVPSLPARFATVTASITAISFTDDELLSDASMTALERWFVNATLTRRRFSPAALEVERVGHLGFFRPVHRRDWDDFVGPALAT